MAVYRFSALRDGQSVSFRPTADLLSFDQSVISAADIRVTVSGAHTRIEVVSGTYAGKDILLLNTTPFQLATSNVTFANGSRLLIGDNTTGQAADNGANSLLGTAGRDHLYGFGGNDTLNGGAGVDRLDGGLGNDTYIVTAGDVLVDAGGIDTVVTGISWTLGAAFENLTITGTSATSTQGNNLSNRMVGNDARNYINARAGNDTLIGNGGDDQFDMSTGGTSSPGNDWIDGGAGRDIVDYGGYARSAVTVDLSAGTARGGGDGGAGSATLISVENAAGGAFADRLTGSSVANFLVGAEGNDTLDGKAGADRLEGGAGNDQFIITLPSPGYLDYPDDGIDTMAGGLGNDIYWVTPGDIVLADPGGIDTVMSPGAYSLGSGLDNLTVVGGHEGTKDPAQGMRLTGNELSNNIKGWAAVNVIVEGRGGNDTLQGTAWSDYLDGGAGNDILWGEGGFDTFFFRAAPGPANADSIRDFGEGTLALDATIFTAAGPRGDFGTNDARFWAAPGATAGHDATDRVVYNTSTGSLYYDADGSGAGAGQLIATFTGNPAIAASDIVVI